QHSDSPLCNSLKMKESIFISQKSFTFVVERRSLTHLISPHSRTRNLGNSTV
ncbi:hypothetical protein HMPREF1869_00082, partial [Bacteroidales bacterium KA00251]